MGGRGLREQQSRAEFEDTDVERREENRQLLPAVPFPGGLAPRPGQSPPDLSIWEFPVCPACLALSTLENTPVRGISAARPWQAG